MKYVKEIKVESIRGSYEPSEKVISNDPEYSYRYATEVIRGRWPKGEPTIMKNYYKYQYINFLKSLGIDMTELLKEYPK
jgi:hypothetical protein